MVLPTHCRIRDVRDDDKLHRPVVMASLGNHYRNATYPHPDPECKDTMKAGIAKRFACDPPKITKIRKRALRRYVAKWCKQNLTPLSSTSDTSVETWLKDRPYPKWRKDQLLTKWHKCGGKLSRKHYAVKSFMKDEVYPEPKHARAINSRTDEFKCKVGPIFSLIEKELFALPYFIKKIPVRDRPKYIQEMLYKTGSKYFATDYKAFESHFTREIYETIEFVMYDYMTKNLPEHDEFMHILRTVIAGLNLCQFRCFLFYITAKRMSGEMCTSLGNGFTNLMILLFLCEVHGGRNVRAVIEGDDALFTVDGYVPHQDHYKECGFNVELEIHTDICTASFCGLIFHPDDNIVVTDPIAELLTFGWTKAKYARSKDSKLLGLMRCKSLSLLYQYRGCPIIQSLALYGLRVTNGYRMIMPDTNMWEYEQLLQAANFYKTHGFDPIITPFATRQIVHEKYGISIRIQLEIEKYLDGLNDVVPLHHPLIDMFVKDHHRDYFYTYCSYQNPKGNLSFPVQTFK